MKNKPLRTSIVRIRVGRRLVQTGVMLLFLFPWLPVLSAHLKGEDVPAFTSWLLPFDSLTNIGKIFHNDLPWIAAGGALFVLAASWIFGRSFCGWICPLGTVIDWIQPLFFWRRKSHVKPSRQNSRARFRLLAFVLTASILSLQFLGWFNPLVIFNRAASAIITNLALLDLSNVRSVPFAVSFMFILILALEIIRPRYWCRNLCPFGALVSLPARYSLLNRRVTNACTYCGDCRNVCPMQAIGAEPHETRYTDCTFCLECEAACPNQGIRFGFGTLAGSRWEKTNPPPGGSKLPVGAYQKSKTPADPALTRRQAIEVMMAGGIGLAAVPLMEMTRPQAGLVRPPGALAEKEFVQTCITCQECIRICPSLALRPALFEGGLTSIGTPILSSRQGACSYITGCPQLCAQVCPVGAIRSIPLSEMKTGIARVDHRACLAWDQGEKCLVCVEACLSDAAKSINGRVIVDTEKCIGCGRCESGCPVPGSAIKVYPV